MAHHRVYRQVLPHGGVPDGCPLTRPVFRQRRSASASAVPQASVEGSAHDAARAALVLAGLVPTDLRPLAEFVRADPEDA